MIAKIETEKCNGCGLCVALCNMDVLRLDDSSNKARIAYREDCMTCFECALSCPVAAITVDYAPGFVPPSIHDAKGGKACV